MSGLSEPIRALAERHHRVAVDSNVLIYLLDDDPAWGETAAAVVDAVATGELEGVIASLGIVETLAGAAQADDGARFELAAATIRDLGFSIAALDADVAEDAAWLRGRSGASLADAVHLACARAAGATAFVTNDRRIRAGRDMEVVTLDQLSEGPPASPGR